MIRINEKQNCTGCYACANICPKECITLKSDNEGFWYPYVNTEVCIECGLCEKICPLLHKKTIENEPKAYACYNKDEIIRMESSSGGIFTLIAEQVLKNKGVVFGACYNTEFKVMHSYVETSQELEAFRGSKYVQSKISETYKLAKDFLVMGRQVLFTGTPCQIGGLKAYLQQDYDNLICIDIICYGVPSPKVWGKYISYLEKCSGEATRRISFRSKKEGWKRFSISFVFKNDVEFSQMHQKNLYMKVFMKNICLRPSCYSCNYKSIHRQSDITLADFWGIENVLPEMDDDKGTSLIFVNSMIGEKMFEGIKIDLKYMKVEINRAVAYNMAALESVGHNSKREKFFEALEYLPFDKLVKKYCSDNSIVKIKRKIKTVIHRVILKIGL